jgi:hypothetical protein
MHRKYTNTEQFVFNGSTQIIIRIHDLISSSSKESGSAQQQFWVRTNSINCIQVWLLHFISTLTNKTQLGTANSDAADAILF